RQPESYEAVVRLSSAPGDIHTDRTPAPRGCAIKVLGVTGDRLVPEIGGHNQDLLMVNFPTLAFGTISKYKDMLQILEKNSQAPEGRQRLTPGAFRITREAIEAPGHKPNAPVEGLAEAMSTYWVKHTTLRAPCALVTTSPNSVLRPLQITCA